jgi:hypothetical protein
MTRAKIQLKPRLDLEEANQPPAAVEPPQADRVDRRGKKIIAGHFPKATWAELRGLCIKHDKTSQDFLDEALTDLFAKYRTQRGA